MMPMGPESVMALRMVVAVGLRRHLEALLLAERVDPLFDHVVRRSTASGVIVAVSTCSTRSFLMAAPVGPKL